MLKRDIKTYTVNQLKNGQYVLVKVLGEYENEIEANDNLIEVVTGGKTEKELLREYAKKKKNENLNNLK